MCILCEREMKEGNLGSELQQKENELFKLPHKMKAKEKTKNEREISVLLVLYENTIYASSSSVRAP